MTTHYLRWMKLSRSWRSSLPNSVLLPGLLNHRFEAWEHPTAASVETVVSTLTTRLRVRDGSRRVTVIDRSRSGKDRNPKKAGEPDRKTQERS
jgi:hypothetical protein